MGRSLLLTSLSVGNNSLTVTLYDRIDVPGVGDPNSWSETALSPRLLKISAGAGTISLRSHGLPRQGIVS